MSCAKRLGPPGLPPGGGGGGAPCPPPGEGGGGAPTPPAPAPAPMPAPTPAPPGGGGGAAIINAQLSQLLYLTLCPNTALYASILYKRPCKRPGHLYTILLVAGGKQPRSLVLNYY